MKRDYLSVQVHDIIIDLTFWSHAWEDMRSVNALDFRELFLKELTDEIIKKLKPIKRAVQ